MAESVLVVDDEQSIREILTAWLEDNGYQAYSSSNGLEALKELYNRRPDLVVADILMPEMDGYEFCRLAREVTEAPIMLLTALGKEQDKVKGFNLGADDYVVKPVGMEEFIARISALLRRRGQSTVVATEQRGYKDDVLIIDLDRHEVWVRDQNIEFTPTEFRLLCFLTDKVGKTCGLREILSRVWDSPHYPFEVVKWHIARLRSKVEEDPRNPKLIVTVRGVGYRYDPPS
ncbi:MAG: response regulator transcription factor [Chloroflexi bacterium]|nr:response regulator transcription factor [Chloroflexota bacterium]